MSLPCVGAFAGIVDTPDWMPPNGWDKLCSPGSIKVTPGVNRRDYEAQGTCWINVAKDKTDYNQQSWALADITVSGFFSLKDNSFRERLAIKTPTGPVAITIIGTCNGDPWASKAICSNKTSPYTALQNDFSWYLNRSQQGPLSSLVFSQDLIQGMLSKQESKPPVAPVGLDAVRWPTNGGKSAIGNISWRAGDMSNNQWVMQFDIEYANYADATFTKAGQRVGLGPKQNMSAAEANRVYVFSTPFALQSGTDYYFRICAVNDAGRQCSAAVKTREATRAEQAGVASHLHTSVGMLGGQPAGSPTAPGGRNAAGGTGAGITGHSGGAAGGGRTGGFGSKRPTVAAAAPAAAGGATPGVAGAAGKPDLAVAREGMLVNDRPVAWNATNRLVLQADASHHCPVRVSFRYSNLGKAAAANVIAEVRDSLEPTQAIATNTSASLAPGQSAGVSGATKIAVTPTEAKVVMTALVHETGAVQDANLSNNRGAITLYVLCQTNGGGTITPARAAAPTAVGRVHTPPLGTH